MTPILNENALEFLSRSPSQTQRLGARLGVLLKGGDVICLEGHLGSGKTCLTQGIGRGWGISETLVSPTFVLVREYTRPDDELRLYHVDLYRIEDANEALTLGIEDVLGSDQAICIFEWAERARSLMPEDHLWINLEYVDEMQRSLHFSARGERHKELLRQFRQSTFGA